MGIKIKNINKIILQILLIFLVIVLLLQQVCTKKRVAAMPKDYVFILSDIRHSLEMMVFAELSNEYQIPDAESLCKVVDILTLVEKQPIKNYGITLIYNKKTKNVYLYGEGIKTTYSNERYPCLLSDKWGVCLLVNKALSEKPKGVYHGFILNNTSNRWFGITTRLGGLNIDSKFPPIPGCFYNIAEKKIYVPIELVPVYKIIYPNLMFPESHIIRPRCPVPSKNSSDP